MGSAREAALAAAEKLDVGDEAPAAPTKPGPTKRAVPRLDLTPKKSTDGSKDGAGSGDGMISSFIEGVETAIDTGLAIAGVPVVRYKTNDSAPGGETVRTTVGVGEMVTFSSNMGGSWKASNGAPAFPKKAKGDQFIWVAMSTKGSATITFDAGAKGTAPITVAMTVIEPTVDYLNPRASAFPGQGAGVAGVQMTTDVTFQPAGVSFANTMWWEKPGPASGATGYFLEHVTKRHKRLPYHHPAADDLQIDATNSGVTDDAGFSDFNGPYKDGSFEWVIPTYYKVVDDHDRHLIRNIHQKCTIAPDGTMTVSKGTASLSRTP